MMSQNSDLSLKIEKSDDQGENNNNYCSFDWKRRGSELRDFDDERDLTVRVNLSTELTTAYLHLYNFLNLSYHIYIYI